MPRKVKTWDVFQKIRPKLREIYRFSPMRREAIKATQYVAGRTTHYYAFKCTLCETEYPIQMAEVDHDPALGSFHTFKEMAGWANNLFYGPVRVICKICHKKVTALQRRKK